MSWTRFAATVSAVVLAGWATCAVASDDEYGRSGPYVGVGAVYAFENFSGIASATTPDDSWGYDLKGGYRFNEYFALEFTWEQFVGFDDGAGDTDIWMAGVTGKFYPFHGIVQPFLAGGIGWSGVDDSRAASLRDTTGLGARFDLGFDVYVTRNIALTAGAGYFLPTSGRADYDVIPLNFGVLYRFF